MPSRKRKVGQVVESPKVRKVRKLSAEKNDCEKVKAVLESAGWREIAQPLLDKMITDTIGGVGRDGMWVAGIIGQGKGYSTEYLLGYRMGLMEFNNRLREKAVAAKKVENQIADLKAKTTAANTTTWSYMPKQGA